MSLVSLICAILLFDDLQVFKGLDKLLDEEWNAFGLSEDQIF